MKCYLWVSRLPRKSYWNSLVDYATFCYTRSDDHESLLAVLFSSVGNIDFCLEPGIIFTESFRPTGKFSDELACCHQQLLG